MNSALGVILSVIALFMLWAIQRVADSLQNINESFRSISESLQKLSDEKGDMGRSPLHSAAWSLRLISRVLEMETGYYQKAEAKLAEENRKGKEEYQSKYGERDRLNEEWAKLYNTGVVGSTTLDFEDWLKEKGIARNW